MNDDVKQAVQGAYRWEARLRLAAERGAQYPQPLHLDRVRALAAENEAALGEWLDAAGVPRPAVPELHGLEWREVLTRVSRGEPGLLALQEAAEVDDAVRPLVERLLAADRVYRDDALAALARIQPDS